MATTPPDNGTTDIERPRVRRLSKEARRAQLLDSAADLLVHGGVDAVTMEAIGQEAGASKTLGYAYFTNVDHVILSLRARELDRLYERVESAAEAASTFEERVTAAFHAYFDVVAERGLLLGELEQAVNARRIPNAGSDATNEFLAWLAKLIDDKYGVGGPRSLAYGTIVAGVAATHAAIWQLTRFSRRHIEGTAVAFALGGLQAAVEHDEAR